MQADVRQQQPHQPEDPIELLIHRVMHRLEHRVVLFEPLLERSEHLVRAVVPGNLGGQQQVDRRRIEADLGMQRAQLVERRDHAMAQRDVGLEQAADERLLRFGGADADEHRRQLVPDVLRRLLVAQPPLDLGNDALP